MSSEKITLDALRIERRALPKKDGARWPIVAVVAVAALGTTAVWSLGRAKPIAVTTTAARIAADPADRTLLNATGYVTARRSATVSSKVTGKVTEMLVEEGMKVETDQVLARLDDSNVQTSLHLAEAQLESAQRSAEETKPNLEFAERELKRFNELAATNVVSDSDHRRSEMEARAQEARLIRQTADIAVAERQLAEWKQNLDDMTIRAPFPGVVTSKNAQPGEMISPMSVGGFTRTGICTIVDMKSLEIEVDVSESYINRVRAGQKTEAVLDAYPDWRIPSKVIAIIPTADRQKATVKVRVGFDQLDPRILPDMGVKVAFQGEEKESPNGGPGAVVLPKAAVNKIDGRDVVWVVKDGRVERRAVTISESGNDECKISGGLRDGERVAINAPPGLTDGSRVTEKGS